MTKRKLLVAVIFIGLIAMVVFGILVWRSKKLASTNLKKDTVVAVDTFKWPTYRVDKLGLSIKTPPEYHQSQLASNYQVDAMFSNLSDQQILDSEKININIDLGPQSDDAGGKISIPKIFIINVVSSTASFDEQTIKQYAQKKSMLISGHPAMIVDDEHLVGYTIYAAYLKMENGYLKIVFNSEDDHRLTFENFINIASSIKF